MPNPLIDYIVTGTITHSAEFFVQARTPEQAIALAKIGDWHHIERGDVIHWEAEKAEENK